MKGLIAVACNVEKKLISLVLVAHKFDLWSFLGLLLILFIISDSLRTRI